MDEIVKVLESFRDMTGMQICIRVSNSSFFTREALKAFSGFHLHRSKFCLEVKKKKVGLCIGDCASLHHLCSAEKDFFLHRCHAGACELNFPLFHGGSLQALVQIGQFSCAKSKKSLRSLNASELAGLECAGRMLASYILRQGLWIGASGSGPSDRSGLVIRFIEDNIRKDPSLRELAVALDLTISRSSHLVRELFGRSYTELKEERRLFIAENHLRNSSARIRWIASECGFRDANYFSLYFRRRKGMSPGEFRRKYQRKLDI